MRRKKLKTQNRCSMKLEQKPWHFVLARLLLTQNHIDKKNSVSHAATNQLHLAGREQGGEPDGPGTVIIHLVHKSEYKRQVSESCQAMAIKKLHWSTRNRITKLVRNKLTSLKSSSNKMIEKLLSPNYLQLQLQYFSSLALAIIHG